MTTAPAAAARGEWIFETEAPGDESTISVFRKSKSARFRTFRISVSPNDTSFRIDRSEADPTSGITIDECATVSRALEHWLDDEQVLGANYVLEVSSPGIERPIRWRRNWERFVGHDVNVRLAGMPRQRATIVAVEPGDVVILRPRAGGEDMKVPLSDVREATLAVDWDEIGRPQADRPGWMAKGATDG